MKNKDIYPFQVKLLVDFATIIGRDPFDSVNLRPIKEASSIIFLIINLKFQIDYNVFNKILFIIINISNYKVI